MPPLSPLAAVRHSLTAHGRALPGREQESISLLLKLPQPLPKLLRGNGQRYVRGYAGGGLLDEDVAGGAGGTAMEARGASAQVSRPLRAGLCRLGSVLHAGLRTASKDWSGRGWAAVPSAW